MSYDFRRVKIDPDIEAGMFISRGTDPGKTRVVTIGPNIGK